MEKLPRKWDLHKNLTERREQAEYSGQITFCLPILDSLSNAVAANIPVALDIKNLFPAHTTCPSTLSGGCLTSPSLRVKGSTTWNVMSCKGREQRGLEGPSLALKCYSPKVTHITSASICWPVSWPCPTAKGQGNQILSNALGRGEKLDADKQWKFLLHLIIDFSTQSDITKILLRWSIYIDR